MDSPSRSNKPSALISRDLNSLARNQASDRTRLQELEQEIFKLETTTNELSADLRKARQATERQSKELSSRIDDFHSALQTMQSDILNKVEEQAQLILSALRAGLQEMDRVKEDAAPDSLSFVEPLEKVLAAVRSHADSSSQTITQRLETMTATIIRHEDRVDSTLALINTRLQALEKLVAEAAQDRIVNSASWERRAPRTAMNGQARFLHEELESAKRAESQTKLGGEESTGPCADRVVGNARPSLLETTLSHMPAFNLPPLDVRKRLEAFDNAFCARLSRARQQDQLLLVWDIMCANMHLADETVRRCKIIGLICFLGLAYALVFHYPMGNYLDLPHDYREHRQRARLLLQDAMMRRH